MTAMQDVFLALIFAWQRKQARKKESSVIKNNIGAGAVIFSQRFGDSLNINPYFHAILPDGVFIKSEKSDKIIFVQIPSPKDADVQLITARLAKRIHRLLEKRGLLQARDLEQPLEGLASLPKLWLQEKNHRLHRGCLSGAQNFRAPWPTIHRPTSSQGKDTCASIAFQP